jgi:hypothetical protein
MGCGWHLLSAEFTKCRAPKNSESRPTGGPIAMLMLKTAAQGKNKEPVTAAIEEQHGGKAVPVDGA